MELVRMFDRNMELLFGVVTNQQYAYRTCAILPDKAPHSRFSSASSQVKACVALLDSLDHPEVLSDDSCFHLVEGLSMYQLIAWNVDSSFVKQTCAMARIQSAHSYPTTYLALAG